MDKKTTAGQPPPLIPVRARAQQHFPLAEPWVTLGFSISSPALATEVWPSCLGGFGSGQGGDASAHLPSVLAGGSCSGVSQAHPWEPRADASIGTSRLTFTVINFCILPHVPALCFLKLRLLWAAIPPAAAWP